MDLKQLTSSYASSLSVEERNTVFGKKFDPEAVTVEQAQRALDDLHSAENTHYSPVGEGKRLMLLLPQYKSTNPATLFSLLGLWEPAKMRATMHYGDAFIAHTRNKLAQDFLASDCEWSLWVDDDMVLPIGNARWFNEVTNLNLPREMAGRHTITRLLESGRKLIGGLYYGRHGKGKPMFAEGANNPALAARLRKDLPQTVQPTQWVGTGCLLVHRDVYTTIQKSCPYLAPKRSDLPWEFFSPAPDELLRLLASDSATPTTDDLKRTLAGYRAGTGEDVSFCRRALAAGIQPHVDLGLVCGHLGGAVYGPGNTTPV